MSARAEGPHVQRLMDMESGDLVQVSHVPTGGRMGTFRLRSGEVLQCIDNGPDGTLVARPDGSRVLIGPADGEAVRVRLCWDPMRGWIQEDAQGRTTA